MVDLSISLSICDTYLIIMIISVCDTLFIIIMVKSTMQATQKKTKKTGKKKKVIPVEPISCLVSVVDSK